MKKKNNRKPKWLKKANEIGPLLADSGLLFEINRTVLNPFGLALVMNKYKDGKFSKFLVIDNSKDPEGIRYDEKTLRREAARFAEFLIQHGKKRLASRIEKLGYAIQSLKEE